MYDTITCFGGFLIYSSKYAGRDPRDHILWFPHFVCVHLVTLDGLLIQVLSRELGQSSEKGKCRSFLQENTVEEKRGDTQLC